MRRLVYEIASIYKTHKFAENFKELGIYSGFRVTEIVDSDLVLLHNVLKL
jgi:hypothetical protein